LVQKYIRKEVSAFKVLNVKFSFFKENLHKIAVNGQSGVGKKNFESLKEKGFQIDLFCGLFRKLQKGF
jgi:hypothetical protein